jgi:hypothetical protein
VGGRGAKSYDREKAWPSINHSIFSGRHHQKRDKSTVENKREDKSGDDCAFDLVRVNIAWVGVW